jgi:hypothetical protein
VLLAKRLHGDDTTVPVLAKGRTRTGRLWTYVRDDRPFGGPAPPAALFRYSPDRRGERPEAHLKDWAGLLQADACAGFGGLYEEDQNPAPVVTALCWAHVRRKFYKMVDIAASARRGKAAPPLFPLVLEAVRRIDAIFDAERALKGTEVAARLAARRETVAPLVAELERWMRATRTGLSHHASVAKAMDYMLRRWPGFISFLEDDRACLTTDDVGKPLFALSCRLGFGRSVPPGFDHAGVGGFCVGHEVHLPVAYLLDPIVPPRAGLVAVLLGRPGAQFELAHLHRHEGGPCPAIRLLLGQERPDQGGDLSRRRHGRDVRALAVLDAQKECPKRARHACRGPGGFDQHRPRRRVALLGDPTVDRAAVARLPDARRQAEVAGKLLRRREATDVADGS